MGTRATYEFADAEPTNSRAWTIYSQFDGYPSGSASKIERWWTWYEKGERPERRGEASCAACAFIAANKLESGNIYLVADWREYHGTAYHYRITCPKAEQGDGYKRHETDMMADWPMEVFAVHGRDDDRELVLLWQGSVCAFIHGGFKEAVKREADLEKEAEA